MKKTDVKKIKKHAKKAVVASVASAGIVVGTLFGSASELMNEDGSSPTAVVELAPLGNVEQDGEDEGLPESNEKRRDIRSRMRMAILALPPFVRALVGLPLWGLGWLLNGVLGALWGAVLSPVLGEVLKFLCIAALMTAVLLISLKAAFPHMKVKDILNKRSVITLVAGLALIGAGGAAAQIFYPEGQELEQLIHWLGGLALLIICAVPAIIKTTRRRQDEEAPVADPEAETRKQALALADSVRR